MDTNQIIGELDPDKIKCDICLRYMDSKDTIYQRSVVSTICIPKLAPECLEEHRRLKNAGLWTG